MQLSPLQSRLAASLVATCFLILLYLALFTPHFALAAEISPSSPLVLLREDLPPTSELQDALRIRGVQYEPAFGAFDRGILGRAPDGVTALVNNVPNKQNVEVGKTHVYVFEKGAIFGSSESARIELRDDPEEGEEDEEDADRISEDEAFEGRNQEQRQAATKTVFLSANTCMQPQRNPGQTGPEAPQLTMYLSTSPQNQFPGPDANSTQQTSHVFNEGALMVNVTTSEDVFFAIHAPNVSQVEFRDIYNFQVAASIDAWYYSYNNQRDSNLIWVDSDATGALLITSNLTDSPDPAVQDAIMQKAAPYVMFAHNVNDQAISGLRHSYCGLETYAQIGALKNGKLASMVTSGLTKRGRGNLPKQQFRFSGLNASSNYQGILAMSGNKSHSGDTIVGGGGHIVARATIFNTKRANNNCRLMQDFTFCNETAYSVPSNPSINDTALRNFYDSYAAKSMAAFEKVLAQIPCEVPPTQRYSLVRNCDDCRNAYRTWLCSVVIPRCEDFSNPDPWLQPRAMNQSFPDGTTLDAATQDAILGFRNGDKAVLGSRQSRIDEEVKPGPYKELLPCADLCFNLMQSCPSAMKFMCPVRDAPGFDTSYNPSNPDESPMKCSYPSSMHLPSGARRSFGVGVPVVLLGVVVGLLALTLW